MSPQRRRSSWRGGSYPRVRAAGDTHLMPPAPTRSEVDCEHSTSFGWLSAGDAVNAGLPRLPRRTGLPRLSDRPKVDQPAMRRMMPRGTGQNSLFRQVVVEFLRSQREFRGNHRRNRLAVATIQHRHVVLHMAPFTAAQAQRCRLPLLGMSKCVANKEKGWPLQT